MTREVAIRRAGTEDAADIATLLGQLGYPVSWGDAVEHLDALLDRPDDAVLVAEASGVLEFISLHRVPRLAEGGCFCRITSFVVAETQRATGVGRRLMAAAEDVARGWGCDPRGVVRAASRAGAGASLLPDVRVRGHERPVGALREAAPGMTADPVMSFATAWTAQFPARCSSSWREDTDERAD